MLAFIYLAYSMMALLYETVPAFEDTWMECLGDLRRYRMAIEKLRRVMHTAGIPKLKLKLLYRTAIPPLGDPGSTRCSTTAIDTLMV